MAKKNKKRSVENAYLDVALTTERISLPVSNTDFEKALAELEIKLKTTGLVVDKPDNTKQIRKLLQDFKNKLFCGIVVDSFGHELKQGDFFKLVNKTGLAGLANPDWEDEYYSIVGRQPVVSSLYPIDEKITTVFMLDTASGDLGDTYLAMETAVYQEKSGSPYVLKPLNRLNLTTLKCLAVNAIKIFPPTVE